VGQYLSAAGPVPAYVASCLVNAWYTFGTMPKEDSPGVLTPETVRKTIELGQLILQFGLTLRATHHEDGETRETDTTHTVMLGVMACAYADVYAQHLDKGKIAQFALVHDLVEVYAGDTPTLGVVDEELMRKKDEREAAALVRLKAEYDSVYPWIARTIEEYEKRDTPEARYVKVFDKVLPKIVHILNKGVTVRSLGHTSDSTKDFHTYQLDKLRNSYGSDQKEAMELLQGICDAVEVARKEWD
jgi:5'-deoxynucleotidase YfbR-like HD superfamily hydrolase